MIIQGNQASKEPDKSSTWCKARAKNPSKDRLSAHFSAHTGTPVPEGWGTFLEGKTGSWKRGRPSVGNLPGKVRGGGNRAGFCSH